MAKAPAGYRGQGFSPRGDKGRYVLPPAFRNAIAPGPDGETETTRRDHAAPPVLGADGDAIRAWLQS